MGMGPKWARGTAMFPSWSRSTTSSIPQTLAALSTMASSTGCTSGGERLMDPGTPARRGLGPRRLTQFCVALAEFREQPNVLDSDHRLIGKGLNEFNLPFGEWLHN